MNDVSLILLFQHPSIEGGRFVCEIGGGEFDAAFGVMGAVLRAASSLRNLGHCPIQCGALKISPRSAAFRASGTLTVAGLVFQGTAQIPFQTSAPIEFEYNP